MSMKAMVLSSSRSLKLGIWPATILQKMQLASVGWLIVSLPVRRRARAIAGTVARRASEQDRSRDGQAWQCPRGQNVRAEIRRPNLHSDDGERRAADCQLSDKSDALPVLRPVRRYQHLYATTAPRSLPASHRPLWQVTMPLP